MELHFEKIEEEDLALLEELFTKALKVSGVLNSRFIELEWGRTLKFQNIVAGYIKRNAKEVDKNIVLGVPLDRRSFNTYRLKLIKCLAPGNGEEQQNTIALDIRMINSVVFYATHGEIKTWQEYWFKERKIQTDQSIDDQDSSEESVHISSWKEGIDTLLNDAYAKHMGGPTLEWEAELKIQLEKNIKKRIKRYLRLGVPSDYSSSYLEAALDFASADAIETVQENAIRNLIFKGYVFFSIALWIIYEFRKPIGGIGNAMMASSLNIIVSNVLYFLSTWIIRLVVHNLKSSMVGPRGFLLNGVTALLLILAISQVYVFSETDRDGWHEVESPDQLFNAKFPKYPVVEDFEDENYGVEFKSMAISRGFGRFSILWLTSSKSQPLYNDVLSKFEAELSDGATEEKFILRKVSESEYFVSFNSTSGESHISRVILDGDNLYQIRVQTLRENANAGFVNKFLFSFEIVN